MGLATGVESIVEEVGVLLLEPLGTDQFGLGEVPELEQELELGNFG